MDTQEIVKAGREHLEKGELALAKKAARKLSKLWKETEGPTEPDWELGNKFLGEILATQAVWSAFKLKPKATRAFLESSKNAESEMKDSTTAKLAQLFR